MDCRRRPGYLHDIEMRLGTARLAFEQPRKDYLLLVGYAVFIVFLFCVQLVVSRSSSRRQTFEESMSRFWYLGVVLLLVSQSFAQKAFPTKTTCHAEVRAWIAPYCRVHGCATDLNNAIMDVSAQYKLSASVGLPELSRRFREMSQCLDMEYANGETEFFMGYKYVSDIYRFVIVSRRSRREQ